MFSDEIYHQFSAWFAEAEKSESNDPNAMCLSTCDRAGRISSRMVLMKSHSRDGIVFYTNSESDKGRAISENPRCALLFHWKSLRRQIRIEGPITPVSPEESDQYFASRPRDSQIGAWASQQSRPMASRAEFMLRIAEFTAKFGLGAIPRPPHWYGNLVHPERIEFWQDMKFRLHQRDIYQRENQQWHHQILYP